MKRILFTMVGPVILLVNLFGMNSQDKEEGGWKRHTFTFAAAPAGYLGVSIRDINSTDVETLSLSAERGVYITGVEGHSPAEEAGLEEGDVVLEYAGDVVFSVRQFRRLVEETPSDRQVQIKVWRQGRVTELNPKIGRKAGKFTWLGRAPEIRIEKEIVPEFKWEDHDFLFDRRDFDTMRRRARLGIQAAALTDQMAEFLGIPGKKGVLILETIPSTPAETAGLQAGDVILSVNGLAVSDPDELRKSLSAGKNEVEFAHQREIRTTTINLTEEKPKRDDVMAM